jgi:hypothetical protein
MSQSVSMPSAAETRRRMAVAASDPVAKWVAEASKAVRAALTTNHNAALKAHGKGTSDDAIYESISGNQGVAFYFPIASQDGDNRRTKLKEEITSWLKDELNYKNVDVSVSSSQLRAAYEF